MQSEKSVQIPHQLGLIALLGIGSALVYAVALLRFPLLAIYNHPIQNLDKLTHSDGRIGLVLAGYVVLLFVGYAVGALLLSGMARAGGRSGARRIALVVIGFALLFIALLLLVYPTTSVDLYDYLFRGRMLVRYEANTFVRIPRDFERDPLYGYVAWKRAVTAYGPLWEGMNWLTARLAGETPGAATPAAGDTGLLRLLLAYKGLAALGFLLCGAAIWAALGRIAPQRRWLGLYLWLWNPLALWESIAAGHNDAWMALLIVLALWMFGAEQGDKETRPALSGNEGRQGDKVTGGRGQGSGVRGQGSDVGERKTQNSKLKTQNYPHPFTRSVGAFLALTAGGLIKFLALFLGPVLLGAALRRLGTWRERGRLVLLGGTACAALVALAYAPFWVGWGTLRNFGDRGTLFTASWLAVLQALLSPLMSKETSQEIAAGLGLGLLLLGMFWATWRAWHAPQNVARHTLWLMLWFLFFCNPWFQPWYLLWALAVAALQPWRSRVAWGVGLFCCTAMLSYVAGSFLLPALGWDVEGAGWNALVSAIIYGPPLVTLGLGQLLSGRKLRLRARALPRAAVAPRDGDVVAR